MTRQERTIKSAREVQGVGLHSGQEVLLRIEPAPAGTGIVFQRTDLEDPPEIPALPGYLSASTRRTALRVGPAEVGVVEHLLAACHGQRIDNLLVKVDTKELPGLDGSALSYLELLRDAGVTEQKAKRKEFVVEEPIHLREGGAELLALPPSGDGLKIRYIPDFPDGMDATPLHLDINDQVFAEEIAPARTFVAADEIEKLQTAGFGKGANRENTLVLGGENPSEMRMDREPTRHKILDLVGDLALLGADLRADLIGLRSGHSLNQALVQNLRAGLEAREMGEGVRETGYEVGEVMRLLPHRYPFLMIDRVIEVEGFRRAVGIKNVTINEDYFQGHWPEKPVMPGVLQLEAIAQLAGVLLQRKLEHTGKLVVLASMDKVRFRGIVVPGDQLRIVVETLRLNKSRGQVQGYTKVGRRVVAEALLSFAMIDA